MHDIILYYEIERGHAGGVFLSSPPVFESGGVLPAFPFDHFHPATLSSPFPKRDKLRVRSRGRFTMGRRGRVENFMSPFTSSSPSPLFHYYPSPLLHPSVEEEEEDHQKEKKKEGVRKNAGS